MILFVGFVVCLIFVIVIELTKQKHGLCTLSFIYF